MIDDLLDEGPDSDLDVRDPDVDDLSDAWVRSVFFGTARRQVIVRCVFCTKDHGHEWAYEAGDRDPGPRIASCKRGRYFVRVRRAGRERLPGQLPKYVEAPNESPNGVASKTLSGMAGPAAATTGTPSTSRPAPATISTSTSIMDALPAELAAYVRDLAEALRAPVDRTWTLWSSTISSILSTTWTFVAEHDRLPSPTS